MIATVAGALRPNAPTSKMSRRPAPQAAASSAAEQCGPQPPALAQVRTFPHDLFAPDQVFPLNEVAVE